MKKRVVLILLLTSFLFTFFLCIYHGTIKTTHPITTTDNIAMYDYGKETFFHYDGDKKYKSMFSISIKAIILIKVLLLFHLLPVWYFIRKAIILNPIYYKSNYLINPL